MAKLIERGSASKAVRILLDSDLTTQDLYEFLVNCDHTQILLMKNDRVEMANYIVAMLTQS